VTPVPLLLLLVVSLSCTKETKGTHLDLLLNESDAMLHTNLC